MKKPIDPNLDNIIDDIISPDNYENADNAEPSLNKADLKDDNEINFSFTGSADVPEKKILTAKNQDLKLKQKAAENIIIPTIIHQVNTAILQVLTTPTTIKEEKIEHSGKDRNFCSFNNISSGDCICRHFCLP